MTNQIYPCLWFDGQAKAAADFYCSIFKNSKITVETPMVVNFELDGKKFMGLNGGPMFKINPSISITATFEKVDEVNQVWGKLIEGGKALINIDKHDWSERYGWLQDKFGLTWQISIVNNEGDKAKITPSLLFTNETFGKAEEAINFYTSIFDNSKIDVLINYPEGSPFGGKVMYSEYNLKQHSFVAMDGSGNHEYAFNEGVSIVVDCKNQEEIDHYWDTLSGDGGQESQCGWVKDKFGVSWQIVPMVLGELMSNPEKGKRVMQVVMQSKKFDIEKLKNA
jgi:predicted 3-demethylubiquinone-9 3-methyltransferase (glyoxalase superfamily)